MEGVRQKRGGREGSKKEGSKAGEAADNAGGHSVATKPVGVGGRWPFEGSGDTSKG